MDSAKLGLLTTLLLGVFILIGALIAFLINKKSKVVDFSIGLALGVISMLIVVDLLPEIIEHLGLKYICIFIIFVVVGFMLLKTLDNFIPDHDEENHSSKELKNNLIHIGIITSLALVLHNIIEGMAVYSSVITSTDLGLKLTLGIGFHNIPFGIVIASSFHQSNQNIWKTIVIIILLSLSTFVGGLIMFFLNLQAINPIILGILLTTTLGMLIYIIYEELFPRFKESKNKKVSYIGVLVGIIILILSMFF